MRMALTRLADNSPVALRLGFDPVEFPRRFSDPGDIEVVGLISAALAYGRADVFKLRIQSILDTLGSKPASFAREYAREPDPDAFRSIVYRFNRPVDFAALVAAIGWMSDTHGSLGERFGVLYREEGLRVAIGRFGEELLRAPPVEPLLRARGYRGLRYLLSDANLPGACKRWHLFLRWMVRGPDAVDLGVWREFVPKSELMIPLDTHIARVSRYLGFTDRSDLSWRTALEITENLRKIDPLDPVRFDFALCHHGMSGACPPTQNAAKCGVCPMQLVCRRQGRKRRRARPT